MLRYFLLPLIFCTTSIGKVVATSGDNVISFSVPSLIHRLDEVLDKKEYYIAEKKHRIDSLKNMLSFVDLPVRKYALSKRLVEEYRSYIYDSAMKYVDLSWEIAMQTKDTNQLNETTILRSNVLLSVGMYKEAIENLHTIDFPKLSLPLLKQYYHCCEQTYHHLSNYAGESAYGKVYKNNSKMYIDSLLLLSKENSNEYRRLLARKLFTEGDTESAKKILLEVLQKYKFGSHDYAVINSTLSEMESSKEDRKRYLLLSAISDVMSAVKENKSLRNLAVELYAEGDIERAYHYCTVSMDDANFYNARLRSIETAQIQPIIEKTYKMKIQEQHKRLQIYLIVITGMFVLLAVFFVFLYLQKKNLDRVKVKLQVSNNELSKLNESLSESNMVKEEYVGRFMSLCSSYIVKLRHYQSMVYSKIATGKIDELKSMTRSSEIIEIEMKQFYNSFDEAFLNIYPNFITEFNKLLREEERIVLPKDKLLSPELRIFALIRLGIMDTDRIAKFLQYSTNTVYSYRTKIKNKAIDKNEFDKKILDIG